MELAIFIKLLKGFGGFLKENWKAAVAIAIVLSVGGYVWHLRGTVADLRDDNVQLEERIEFQVEALTVLRSVNKNWTVKAEEWEEAIAELQGMADSYATNAAAERERRLAALRELDAVKAELHGQITADNCDDALDELLDALDWSGQ